MDVVQPISTYQSQWTCFSAARNNKGHYFLANPVVALACFRNSYGGVPALVRSRTLELLGDAYSLNQQTPANLKSSHNLRSKLPNITLIGRKPVPTWLNVSWWLYILFSDNNIFICFSERCWLKHLISCSGQDYPRGSSLTTNLTQRSESLGCFTPILHRASRTLMSGNVIVMKSGFKWRPNSWYLFYSGTQG